MATPEQIDLAEADLTRLIQVGKKQGLNSWDWLNILLRACIEQHLQAAAEYKLKSKE